MTYNHFVGGVEKCSRDDQVEKLESFSHGPRHTFSPTGASRRESRSDVRGAERRTKKEEKSGSVRPTLLRERSWKKRRRISLMAIL